MSKLSFRARALDATKPLPIYNADDLPDLSDFSTINRTVPQMPTGMEKEEESERHLQDVIQAKQANSVKKKHVYIPTPEAAIPVKHYEEMTEKVNRAHHYIRVPGLGLEEVPDYDLDSEDEEWLNAQSNERPLSPTHFELMMDKLEKGSGNTVLSEREAQGLLRDDENLVLAVYDYWLAKRLRLGRPLIPVVKHEGRDGGSGSNPYLAFRKRTEKMQTRKNRKNDETAYMQMLKLKRDLEKAVTLFEWVKDREQKKEELAQAQANIFKKRFQLEDWSGSILSSLQASTKSRRNSSIGDWDHRSRIKLDADYDVHHVGRHDVLVHSGRKKKRGKKYSDVHSEAPLTPSTPDKITRDSTHDLSSDRLDDEEYEGLFSFKRKPHVRYHTGREPLGAWPWSNDDNISPTPKDHPEDGDVMIMDYSPYAVSHAASRERARNSSTRRKFRFCRTSLSGGSIGFSRRRVGRGGRVMWDRLTLKELQDNVNVPPRSDDVSLKDSPPTDRLDELGDCEEGGESGGPVEMSVDGEEPMDSSRHFQPHSPLSSSSAEYTHLPLIEQPGAGDSASSRSSVPTAVPFSGFSLAFRGMPLTSEFREDAKTFSALPTSQFFLKSLTPHADSDYQGSLLSSDSSWGLMTGVKGQPGLTRTASENSSNSPLNSPSAPGNCPNGLGTSDTGNADRARQVSTESDQNVTKELSRSSLSVADSKTIVLSNVPFPRPKHQLEKTQKLSSSSDTAQKETSKTPANVSVKLEPSKDGPTLTKPLTEDKSGPGSSENNSALDKESGQTKKPEEKVAQKDTPENAPSISLSTTCNTPTTDSKPNSSSTVEKAMDKKTSTATQTISTPAEYILRFDVAPVKNRQKSALRKKSKALLSSLSTATLITSQLGLFQAAKKKDPALSNGQPTTPTALGATELLASGISTNSGNSVSTLSAAKLAEIQSSLLNSQDKVSTPSASEVVSALSGSVDRKTTVSTTNASAVTSLASVANAVTANSHVGQALSGVTSAVARRASTGTNGTNYQEIFHTATRRISESAERGLKQALAGMNHNSLIETANTLVQLSNSSEVT